MCLLHVTLDDSTESKHPGFLNLNILQTLEYLSENWGRRQILWLDGPRSCLVLDREHWELSPDQTPDHRVLKKCHQLLLNTPGFDSAESLSAFLNWWVEVSGPDSVLLFLMTWFNDCSERLAAGFRERIRVFINELRSGRRARPMIPPSSQENNTPSEIKVECFGSIEVLIGAQVLSEKDWRTRKALSIFLYLALEAESISGHRLQEIIWPGRGEENRRNFQTSVSRVRKTLRSSGWRGELRRSRGGLYSLQPRIVSSSKSVFETSAKALIGGDFEYHEAKRTVAIYKGPFLSGLDEMWVLNARRRYLNLWFRLTDLVLEAELSRGNFQEAEELASKMLAQDGAREKSHLAKIKALFLQNRRREAIDAFKLFKKVLKKSLGLEPSARALELIRTWKRAAG